MKAVNLLVVFPLACGGLAELSLDFFDFFLFLLELRFQVIDCGLLVLTDLLGDLQLLVSLRDLFTKHFIVFSKLLILLVLGVLFRR